MTYVLRWCMRLAGCGMGSMLRVAAWPSSRPTSWSSSSSCATGKAVYGPDVNKNGPNAVCLRHITKKYTRAGKFTGDKSVKDGLLMICNGQFAEQSKRRTNPLSSGRYMNAALLSWRHCSWASFVTILLISMQQLSCNVEIWPLTSSWGWIWFMLPSIRRNGNSATSFCTTDSGGQVTFKK
jgi:hypothetical protein